MKLKPQIKWHKYKKGSLFFKTWTIRKYKGTIDVKAIDVRDTSALINHLIERTNHRDDLFKQIEMAILGNDRSEALKLAREGWQLAGR